MTIAFDAVTSKNSPSNLDVSHVPVGTPKAVLVLISQGDADTDEITSVTYGGVSMTEVSGSPFIGSSFSETGSVYAYFLGSSIPTGEQTVDVTHAAGGSDKLINVITYTAAGDTEIQAVDTDIDSASATNPSGSISLGGMSCAVAMVLLSGQNATSGVAASSGWGSDVSLINDFGTQVGGVYTYDTIGTSDVTYGWTQTAEDALAIAVAIKEAAGGGATNLTVADSTHSHAADNAVLTSSHLLTVADSAHAHSADNLSLSTGILLALSDALHGHTADNLDLTALSVLVVAEALHSHIADNVVLSLAGTESLIVADATHGHAADNLDLTTQLALSIAEAAHAHTADGIVITSEHVLAVADALHAHAADNVAIFTGAIGVPANLAGVPTTATIDWSWDAVAGATGYEIEFGPDGGGYTVVDVGNNLTYEQTGLSAATLYEARVRAYIDTAANRIILESGDGYLLESGDSLLQEAA